jgi:tRNA pseudouridine13 synthase
MEGEWQQALESLPKNYRDERLLMEYLLKAGENYAGAKSRLRGASRKLYFTAYQAYLFNIALAERLKRAEGDLGKLFEGDVAFLHRNGAVFKLADPAVEQARADAFEISPSGPIFGMKMLVPSGLEAEIEREILAREGMTPGDFHQLAPKLHLEGGRRPFRVSLSDDRWRLEGSDILLEFFLPKGSYATTVLRELMKNDQVPDAFYAEGEGEKHGLWRPPEPGTEVPQPAKVEKEAEVAGEE